MIVSIIIRTLNEEKYLKDLLSAVEEQECRGVQIETVLVDSGSSDRTLSIAESYGCRIVHISREAFSFGRSLNIGCEASSGEILVMISGHCVPTDRLWLRTLCQPLVLNKAGYVYGRQIGGSNSYYSECRIFAKYFSTESKIPQQGFYCNNANSAIKRSLWEKYRFNEELTGLEDMELAKRLVNEGNKVAYVAEACVYHHHEENWRGVKRRFEREAIALQKIMPQLHIRKRDLVRYIISSIWLDFRRSWQEQVFFEKAYEIIRYRFAQYWGGFVGNNDHRKLSHVQKEEYFYPADVRSKHEE